MKQEGARAGALSRRYCPQVAPAPPPEQVRPVLQELPLQHRWVAPPQAVQLEPPPVAVVQAWLSAVQKPLPVGRAQHGSPDPPQAPASPLQTPAWQMPLLLGQSVSSAMQVP
jgi:hypothetical protein